MTQKIEYLREGYRRLAEAVAPHGYEPGDEIIPGQTDPVCRICGTMIGEHPW